MISVLLFSDPEVKQKLFGRVDAARRPLLVAQVRQDRFGKPVDEREPFAAIEDVFGQHVDQLIVADDGKPEGMWRDPVGDLADRFFPHDRGGAYAAATGYMLIVDRKVVATAKKHGPAQDLWFLQDALAAHVPGIPAPDPQKRPGQAPRPRADTSRQTRRPPPRPHPYDRYREQREPEPEPEPPPPPPSAPTADPWAVLGVTPGTPLADARRAFRALIAQYHPDKVSHLAPEFQELADRRTRELLDAWQKLEAEGEER